jgi:hypothetical protein
MEREHLCPNPSRDSREFSGILGQVSGGALAASCDFLRVFAYVRKMKTKIPIDPHP